MPKPKTVLMYSHSGGTKTSQLYHLAKYVNRKWGQKSRLVTFDGGGWTPFEDSGMIANPETPYAPGGICEAVDFSFRPKALADVHRIGDGYWPYRGKKTGREYFDSSDKCKTTPDKFAEIGAYFFEGITSLSDLWLNHISAQEGGVGFKEAWKYEEDGYTIQGLQDGHYNIVQKEIYKFIVHQCSNLPIRLLVFTALVGAAEDKYTKISKYGPKSAGKATTLSIPAWFQHTLHLDKIREETEEKIVERRVAFFEEHPDRDTGIMYLAKPRIIPELYQNLKKVYPGGYVKLGFKTGVDKYFETLDTLNEGYRASGMYKGFSQTDSQQVVTPSLDDETEKEKGE